MAGLIVVIYTAAFHATAFDSFLWSGTIGTLILLVAYVLATLGCTMLVFVRRKLPVPMWQVVVPIAALVVLGYTLYRNVIPYPTGAGAWFPVVSGAWLAGGHRGRDRRAGHGAQARGGAGRPRGHRGAGHRGGGGRRLAAAGRDA